MRKYGQHWLARLRKCVDLLSCNMWGSKPERAAAYIFWSLLAVNYLQKDNKRRLPLMLRPLLGPNSKWPSLTSWCRGHCYLRQLV